MSKLHSEILKNDLFKDFYRMYPDRFDNVTNGIAHRRWLCYSNPELAGLLDECIGTGYRHNPEELAEFAKFADDATVRSKVRDIKHRNKVEFSNFLYRKTGQKLDTHSVYDVQIKRMHEYKRQLLNVLHILRLYLEIKDDPQMEVTPRTFIFAAKASAGYQMAKRIISLIVAVADMVNADPAMHGKLKVVFIEDYKVSLAEIIIPAADISEQISVAGKEASGTGNMKLMINGAVTLGTLDGANVEICQQVGEENMFLFGLHAEQVKALWRSGYDPRAYLTPGLQRVFDLMCSGALGGKKFDDIVASLTSNRFGTADGYMTVADFESYCQAQQKVGATWRDARKFGNMSLVNIAKAGIFSSDRAVEQYAEEIWNLD